MFVPRLVHPVKIFPWENCSKKDALPLGLEFHERNYLTRGKFAYIGLIIKQGYFHGGDFEGK